MNTIEQLNNYSKDGLAYTDVRPTIITLSSGGAINQTATAVKGGTFYVPNGIEFTKIQNPAADDIVYTVDISNAVYGYNPNVTLAFNTTSTNVAVSTSSNGVYRVTGISTLSNWNQIKNPLGTLPAEFDTSFTIQSNIYVRPTNTSYLWSTNVSVDNTGVSNMQWTRYYLQNTVTDIFANATPQIHDITPTSTYTITLQSNAGGFSANTLQPSYNYSFTGTMDDVNTVFHNIRFFPNKNVIGSQTFTYKQYEGTEDPVNLMLTKTVTLLGNAYSSSGSASYYDMGAIGGSGFNPSWYQRTINNCDILVVGAGGNGGTKGGGGAGQVRFFSNVTLPSTGIIPVQVGTPTPGGKNEGWTPSEEQARWSRVYWTGFDGNAAPGFNGNSTVFKGGNSGSGYTGSSTGGGAGSGGSSTTINGGPGTYIAMLGRTIAGGGGASSPSGGTAGVGGVSGDGGNGYSGTPTVDTFWNNSGPYFGNLGGGGGACTTSTYPTQSVSRGGYGTVIFRFY